MALNREGLIDRRPTSAFIEDWDELAAIGVFSPRYLHLQDQEQRT